MISVEISQLLGDLYPRPRKKKQTALVPKELQLSAFLSIGNSIRYVIILLLLTASAMWISVSYRYVMRVQDEVMSLSDLDDVKKAYVPESAYYNNFCWTYCFAMTVTYAYLAVLLVLASAYNDIFIPLVEALINLSAVLGLGSASIVWMASGWTQHVHANKHCELTVQMRCPHFEQSIDDPKLSCCLLNTLHVFRFIGGLLTGLAACLFFAQGIVETPAFTKFSYTGSGFRTREKSHEQFIVDVPNPIPEPPEPTNEKFPRTVDSKILAKIRLNQKKDLGERIRKPETKTLQLQQRTKTKLRSHRRLMK